MKATDTKVAGPKHRNPLALLQHAMKQVLVDHSSDECKADGICYTLTASALSTQVRKVISLT
jgi:hypothetical protein